jgi:O-antigen/teichoic acid export membrane protein
VIANVIGHGAAAVLGFIFIPVYLRLLGTEAFGIIALFVSFQALAIALDFGLVSTVNRELARLNSLRATEGQSGDVLRTMEVLFWPIAVAVAMLAFALAGPASEHWLRTVEMRPGDARRALELMGLAIAALLPSNLYSGALSGLQRFVALNALATFFAIARTAGAAIVLWAVDASLQAFFVYQIVVSVIQTAVLATVAWKAIPAGPRSPRFDAALGRKLVRFSASLGIMGIAFTVFMYGDRLVLSGMLNLQELGAYGIAAVLGGMISRLIQPINSAAFPRFSAAAAVGSERDLVDVYHNTSQIVAACAIPVAVLLAVFPSESLLAWTGKSEIAAGSAGTLVLLTIGNLAGGLGALPYSAQLAVGRTRLPLMLTMASLVLYFPLVWLLVEGLAAPGAALAWAIVNTTLLVAGIELMHRSTLISEKRRWICKDLAPPLLSCLTVAGIARIGLPSGLDRGASIVACVALALLLFVVAMVSTRYLRSLLMESRRQLLAGLANRAQR